MSEISKQALAVENTTNFPNNNTGYITPALLRSFNTDLIDSTVNQIVYTADSSSWNSKISQLNAFTASQQPSFTAINAFTASQLNINSGYNTFTQSAGAELDSLSAWTGSWNDWTSSINEIRDDGVLQGYSTRFYFNGLVSASIVQNVNGPIANVTVEQDGTKLNTSSFNDYSASNAASQSAFSASVSSSISQLLGFSSSLDATFATDAQLTITASTLQANIDTKLNTSSFNSYTQSITEAGYATTGSNSFNGNQNITGSITVSGNTNITPASVSANANYVIPFISGSTISKDSVDTLFYNPSANQLLVSASTGQATLSPNSILFTSGSGTAAYSSTVSKNAINNVSSPGYYIGISGNPSQIGAPSLASNTKPGILALSGSSLYVAVELQNSQSYTDGRVTIKKPLVAEQGSIITGSLLTNGGAIFGNASSQYNSLTVSSSLASYPGNLFNSIGIDTDGGGQWSAGMYVSTYSSFGSNPQFGLYGGGVGNNGDNNVLYSYGNLVRINKNTQITGSLTITGSVYQNVNAVSIDSSTASIDLSVANYFTLTLTGATNINVINPQPGVTATLVINTGASVTASFSSNVKQPSGSLYVASPSGNIDIITFTAVNSSTVFAFPAQSFV